jgi:two-component system response regulator FixJ
VYIIDDEPAVCRSLSLLLGAAGYQVRTFTDGEAFLEAASHDLPFICVLLDLRMSGMSGLAVQQAMAERRLLYPVVLVTGHGDVPAAVQAMKAGACDFLQKPFSAEEMLQAVEAALLRGDTAQAEMRAAAEAEAEARVSTLSHREREVLKGLVVGPSRRCGISASTRRA